MTAILVPTLRRAREAAKSALRQIGQGVHTYAIDSKGWLVPAWIKTQAAGQGVENWATLLVNGRFLPAPKQQDIAFHQQGADGDSVLRCPSGENNKHDQSSSGDGRDDPEPDSQRSGFNRMFWRRKPKSSGVPNDTW